MGCKRCFVASLHEVLLDEDDSRSSSRVREHGSSLLVSQLHVAIQTLWSQCLLPRVVWTNRWIVHSQVSPCLFALRLRFRLRLCLSLHVQQTLAHNSLQVSPCLRWYFRSQNKTSFSISWVSEPDGCSLLTSLTVLTSGFLDFGWICWESLLPPATSEPNSFIQLSKEEIFGGCRGDAYTFSYVISPVSIIVAFGAQ